MRTAYYLLGLLLFLAISLQAQKTSPVVQPDFYNEIRQQLNSKPSINISNPVTHNIAGPGNPLSLKALKEPRLLKRFINANVKKQDLNLSQTKHYRNQAAPACSDTSFVKLLSGNAKAFYVYNIIPTSDGGSLIPGTMYDTSITPHYNWRSFAVLIKVDRDGNLLWLKQFDEMDPVITVELFMNMAFELSNHDIIVAGGIDTASGSKLRAVVYRLNSSGNLIWKQVFRSDMPSSANSGFVGQYQMFIKGLAEGLNGDLILVGDSYNFSSTGSYETIMRLTGSGNLVWDANYGNDGPYLLGAEAIQVYVQNGQILEVGLSHGSNSPQTPSAVNFLTLDYNTGNLINKNFFRPVYSDPWDLLRKSFLTSGSKCTKLSNGNFVVYGKLISDYLQNTTTIDHFGVMEFTATLNLIRSYTISSNQLTNYNNDLLQFDQSGKAAMTLFEYISGYEANVFFASIEHQQFLNQRKVHYQDVGMPGNSGIHFFNDGGYVYAQSHFESQGKKSFVEYRKMHDSDTSSVCMGKDTFFLQVLPWNVVANPGYFCLDDNVPHKVVPLNYNLSYTDTIVMSNTNACRQTNYCDTVKIHGTPVICGSQPAILYTAYKNSSCGAIVQWNIDPAGIAGMQVQSDTSVLITFQNANWQGQLYASLPAGQCYTAVIDSMGIAVINFQDAVDLGPDTVLCANNNIILNAGSGFSNYLWQNGSTGSFFTVSAPGSYYVQVSDLCGNSFSDTVIVTAANYPFSIGNDTIRCNNDSLHLTATGNFINYQWQPTYNINSVFGQTVSVLPLVDTSYIATAQKWPGCFVKDTIHISVYSSPPIFLGNDTSLCIGSSVILNSGVGFNSYLWNTGSFNQQIIVDQQGLYFVKAFAPNGCMSTDSFRILQVFPLPVFSLGNDTILCRNTAYSYQFNLLNASYLWNDGSTIGQYSISTAGIYSLEITQQGCKARDTVIINYKENPLLFLGRDTTLCMGNNYTLHAENNNATYLWQDGSISPQYEVMVAGDYFVTVNLNNCFAKDSIHVDYLSKPFFTLGKDTTICVGQKLLLQPLVSAMADYLWQDATTHPTFLVLAPGLYTLEATNSCGSFSDSIILTSGFCDLMMPSIFTPNGDGNNDLFRVKFPFPAESFQFSVFNRYGQKIFETTDMNQGWNGTYKYKDQPAGSYVWVIKIKRRNNFTESNTGMITLIR